MSIKEKLVEFALLPFTSAVDIRFSRNVKAKTIYQKDYPISLWQTEVKEGRIRVKTGSTMAFEVTDKKTGDIRAIVVRDYRERTGVRGKVRIKEAHRRKDGSIFKTELADLDRKHSETYLYVVGKFSWRGE